MLPVPLPPGNYTLHQGIPARLILAREGEPLYPETGGYNRDVLEFTYFDRGNVHIYGAGIEGSCTQPFSALQPDVQKTVNDRFEELFDLDIGQGNHGPRDQRTKHYKQNPATIVVKE